MPHVHVTFAFGIIAATSASEPWQHAGELTPAFDPAVFAGFGWELQLPPEQAAMLRSIELAEKAEERERQERLAEHQEQSYNRCVAESIARAHAAGRPWDPARPLEFYPTHGQRVAEAFAAMDAQAAAELRQAKHAAARVLREHGVNAQVVVDANDLPHPGPFSSGGSTPPAPGPTCSGPEVAAQRHTPRRSGAPRLPGESSYMRLRAKRFFDRVGRKGQR